ncbi:MAG TPA: 16S rRNA (guanine(527)-N(7))-methyltransferase RsmG [Beutenbergiaceae bacterium]|nr:16S rRNA (guanine(527)-N(7))-methyltransferase RsmG [Beutenbergiaceae bacterium]
MPDIIGGTETASREIFGLGLAAAEEFGQMLADEGELRGLIGPREVPRLWRRHILNSAAVGSLLPASGTVADVGSGAGLPGIVLAIMRPDLEFDLIEPMERRADWLAEVIEALDLDNVTIHQVRAEELHKKRTYDVVTARAVAGMDKLLRFTVPLIGAGGRLLALKGRRVYEEIEDAKYVLKKFRAEVVAVHEIDVLGDGDVTFVAEVQRA